jgi:hypothetical protein
MNISDLPDSIVDKIYEVKRDDHDRIAKIISYFPLTDSEKQVLQTWSHKTLASNSFVSIFSDKISDVEWDRTKEQIKKRFRYELFDIDKSYS